MGSTNTSLPTLEAALAGVPSAFRGRLIKAYVDLKSAHARRQYDVCGLRAGKFCEVLIRYLQQTLTGNHVPFGTRIPNFTAECRALERVPQSAGHEALRILIPRSIDFVYSLRNKRDIGHVGGDVDANEIDAATAVRSVDWCLAELIRLSHRLPLEDAQALLDAIAAREMPTVWAVGGGKRVLRDSYTQAEETLVLLYSDLDTAVPVEDLCRWIEVPRLADYRKNVLVPLHKRRLIEYDRSTETVVLSPTGAVRAEELIR